MAIRERSAAPRLDSGDSMPALTFSPIGSEALDDPATDPVLVDRMVRDIARSNRWLGGAAAVRFGLSQLLGPADRGHELTLFDIGTGAADLPLDAARWARRRGITLVPLALERLPAAAQRARRNGVPVVLACASALPLPPRSVDIVLVSQVAHHLDAESAAVVLAAAGAVAKRGVVVADLRPSPLAATGFRCAGLVLGLHPMTVADGVTSLRRGFHPAALQAICARARAINARVVARPFARIVAWWRTDGAS